jgi:hypothetical protein
MFIRTSIFDFLRTENLNQFGKFSPSVESGATIDHYNDLKLYFCVINLIVEFNVIYKSCLGIEIGQLCAEIPLLSLRKTSKIGTSREKSKIFKILYFHFFYLNFLIIIKKILIYLYHRFLMVVQV